MTDLAIDKSQGTPATTRARRKRYVVWSFDADEAQVMVDVVMAVNKRCAARKVARGRPYATVDHAALLEDHVTGFVKALASSPKEIENKWRAVAHAP